jgi:hypothetical protein
MGERLPMPFESLPDIVLSNVRSEDPNATMTLKQKRRVNGVEVWFLKMDAELNGIPLTLCGYYYSGKSGTVQVVMFTGKNLFSEFAEDFMGFLNGLWISE